jgi:hypothetical protein
MAMDAQCSCLGLAGSHGEIIPLKIGNRSQSLKVDNGEALISSHYKIINATSELC